MDLSVNTMADTPSQRPSPVHVRDEREALSVPNESSFTDIETIRDEVNGLAGSEKMDKDSALTMTRLFHSMETLMRHECTRRDAQISRLECEIERARIQHELDRVANSHLLQQQQQGVEPTPLRRGRSKW
jgi:hypothetical protein